MDIIAQGIILAGFVLAHSAWSVSDVPEILVPLAIVERNGDRKLIRIEMDSQAEAILKGKSFYDEWTRTADAWAFAREGLLPEGNGKVDVFVVDYWAKGMSKPATIIQRFEPFSKRKRFRIIGDAMIAMDGKVQSGTVASDAMAQLNKGIRDHPKAAQLWDTWRRP